MVDQFARVDPQQCNQLAKLFERQPHDEVFEGLFAVLTSDERYVAQQLAGRLLIQVMPACPRTDLDTMLRSLLPVWDRSVEQVPWYLERAFGRGPLHDAIRRVGSCELDATETAALGSFGFWVHFPRDNHAPRRR